MIQAIKRYQYSGKDELVQWLFAINGGEDPVIIPYNATNGRLSVCVEHVQDDVIQAFTVDDPLRNVSLGRLWFCNVDELAFAEQMSVN